MTSDDPMEDLATALVRNANEQLDTAGFSATITRGDIILVEMLEQVLGPIGDEP